MAFDVRRRAVGGGNVRGRESAPRPDVAAVGKNRLDFERRVDVRRRVRAYRKGGMLLVGVVVVVEIGAAVRRVPEGAEDYLRLLWV